MVRANGRGDGGVSHDDGWTGGGWWSISRLMADEVMTVLLFIHPQTFGDDAIRGRRGRGVIARGGDRSGPTGADHTIGRFHS